MKNVFILLLTLMTMQCATATDKPINVNQLPAKAQTFVETYFKSQKVILVTQDDELLNKNYDISFSNGDKVEFDKNGNWTEVNCKAGVPEAIVPETIRNYVKTNFPEERIVQIEKERKGTQIKLSNRMELTFNAKGKLIEVDD